MTYEPDFQASSDPAAEGINPGSPLEALREELSKDVAQPDLVLNIPGRKKLRCVYDTSIDGDKFQLWQRNSKQKGSKDELNIVRFSCTVIGNQLKGLEVFTGKDWEVARDELGQDYNVRNGNLKKMLFGEGGEHSGVALIRKLYGNDGVILSSAKEILEVAGYGDESSDLFGSDDPTAG